MVTEDRDEPEVLTAARFLAKYRVSKCEARRVLERILDNPSPEEVARLEEKRHTYLLGLREANSARGKWAPMHRRIRRQP